MHTLPSTRPDVNHVHRESRPVRRARERAAEKAYQARHRQENRLRREDLVDAARKAAEQKVQGMLEAQVDGLLGRSNGQHQDRKDPTELEECCHRCGTHLRRWFRRKGFYRRSLGTLMGELQLRVPRVRCRCGGDVSIVYWAFLPYERRFIDVNGNYSGGVAGRAPDCSLVSYTRS